MGWGSAGLIFDRVALALVKANADAGLVTDTCAALIRELVDGDWDTLDASIEAFRDQPAVMAAFRRAAPDWLDDAEEAVRVTLLTWDVRQQPDMLRLAAAVAEYTDGRVHLVAVDTGGDEYAWVVADGPLDEQGATRVWRAAAGYEDETRG